MASKDSETEELLGAEKGMLHNQQSVQFDISARSQDFIQLLQDKNLKPFWKPPATDEGGDWVSDSDDSEASDSEEKFELDIIPRRKELSKEISDSGIQDIAHKDPVLVLTDDRKLPTTNSYYGLLTCSRYLQKKDIRSKMDVIGVKKKIETGSYTSHTSEYLYLLYSFQEQKLFNDMCKNLNENVSRFIRAKTKKSDRIPIALQPARPIYSKLKSCLELSVPLKSFHQVFDYLQPLFVSLDQSVFHLTGNSKSVKELAPYTNPISNTSELPSFALCIQFSKVIKPETLKQFNQKSWSTLNVFPKDKSLFCYVNTVLGKSLPYIFCETGIEAGMYGSMHRPGFIIYLFVPGGGEHMSKMTAFYNALFSDDRTRTLEGGRVIYSLLSEAYSDRELMLIQVPDKNIFQQDSLTLYIHTTDILSIICKLNCAVSAHGEHCVAVTDPLGNKVVLRDLSHAPLFKDNNPSEGLKFTT